MCRDMHSGISAVALKCVGTCISFLQLRIN